MLDHSCPLICGDKFPFPPPVPFPSTKAEKTFDSALRFNRRNANTLIRLAACRLELGKTSEALAGFTAAQRLDDANPDVYFHKAQAHISMGAAVMAFPDLKRAIELGTKQVVVSVVV